MTQEVISYHYDQPQPDAATWAKMTKEERGNWEGPEYLYLARIEVTEEHFETGTGHTHTQKRVNWVQVLKDGEEIPVESLPRDIRIHLEVGASEAFDWDAIAQINQHEWDRAMELYYLEREQYAIFDLIKAEVI